MTSQKFQARNGVAVAIRRKDGSEFFASCSPGIGRAVWNLGNRKYATEHAKTLRREGFKCRVVRVVFADPIPA